jgi:hypothetical protein
VNGGTAATSGAVTLTLPQSIATTSSVTFGGAILNGIVRLEQATASATTYDGTVAILFDTLSLTAGTAFTFPATVVLGQHVTLVNAKGSGNITVASTNTNASGSMVLTVGDTLTAKGVTDGTGNVWAIGV